jgi:hypothetical protein
MQRWYLKSYRFKTMWHLHLSINIQKNWLEKNTANISAKFCVYAFLKRLLLIVNLKFWWYVENLNFLEAGLVLSQ